MFRQTTSQIVLGLREQHMLGSSVSVMKKCARWLLLAMVLTIRKFLRAFSRDSLASRSRADLSLVVD